MFYRVNISFEKLKMALAAVAFLSRDGFCK